MNNFNLFLEKNIEGLYIVEKGDTLSSIAKKFTTTKYLIILDNFLTEEVKEKDYLYIRRYKTVYEVEPFDTLDSIALKFNKSKEEILRVNKINYIYPTQKIIID